MQDLSDSDFDKKFRDAAENYRPEYDPAAWTNMTERLDTVAKPSVFWSRKSIAILGAGVISIAGLIWYINSNEAEDNNSLSPDQAYISNNTASSEELLTESTVKKNSYEAEDNKLTNVRPNSPITLSTKSSGIEKKKPGNVTLMGDEMVNSNSSDIHVDSINTTEKQSHLSIKSNQIYTDSAVPHQDQADLKHAGLENDDISIEAHADTDNGKNISNRWSIRLSVSPDFSSDKVLSNSGKVGYNYGTMIGYQISKNWSVATGGIWSRKYYTAYDVEYGYYNADWVDGDCRMWDIPVNLYYQITPGRSLSFFAGIGLSSYLMKEENYVFYVQTPYKLYDYPKQVLNENNEWFSVINLSIGIQKQVNSKLSLQVEPFLKAPLAGVGEGDVSLASYGAFFNVQYQFIKNKP